MGDLLGSIASKNGHNNGHSGDKGRVEPMASPDPDEVRLKGADWASAMASPLRLFVTRTLTRALTRAVYQRRDLPSPDPQLREHQFTHGVVRKAK